MPIRETIECWNCGRNYDPDEHEVCPSCEEHPKNNPDLYGIDEEEYEVEEDEDYDE